VEKGHRLTRDVRGKLSGWRQAAARAARAAREPPFQRYVEQRSNDGGSRARADRGMLRGYGMDYECGRRYEELAGRGSYEELELEERMEAGGRRRWRSGRQGARGREESCLSAPPWPREAGGRAIDLEEQFLPQDLQRLSEYPKSLRDLKYLEIEAILGRDPRPVGCTAEERRLPGGEGLGRLGGRGPGGEGSRAAEEERRWMRGEGVARGRGMAESCLAGGSQIERYEPGKVHYEREYRIYGKDTVALIFYKTCYL
jgi:hypothetical protein